MDHREVTLTNGQTVLIADLPGALEISVDQPGTEVASVQQLTPEEHAEKLDQLGNSTNDSNVP